MKSSIPFGVALLALAALCTSVAAHATNVAKLPIKASVLAKPNVIFGFDDSGSMDAELLLPNNDGAFWWDFTVRSGWDANGKTWFNDAGNSSNQWRKFIYLFPNGTGTGNRVYGDAANDHFVVLPTRQFAFLRSPAFNGLYYDPAVTYKPWSPSDLASSPYGNASKTAGRSHPIYGDGTFNVSVNRALTTDANQIFTAMPGMTLPAGSQRRICTAANGGCGAWADVGTDVAATSDRVTQVAMSYFPATYYLLDDRTEGNCATTPNASDCAQAPDLRWLRRFEIKRDHYPDETSYNAAIQNFANWFTYYRKRKLMVNAAVGQALEPLTGLHVGMIQFNTLPVDSTRIELFDLDEALATRNGRHVAGLFYGTNGSGGTPTRETLKRIGEEFARPANANPNLAGPIKFACQRNNAFIVTDGFANASTVAPRNSYDRATWGFGRAPYETIFDNTLANLALYFYTRNPRTDLTAGLLGPIDSDANTSLHVNTYGLTIGSRGLLFQDDDTPQPTTIGAWTNPTQNRHPSSVDDLWHATINGRGKMYLATTPQDTAKKIQKGLKDILTNPGAQGGVSFTTVNLSKDADVLAYVADYNSAGWTGDLKAKTVDRDTGAIGAKVWSADEKLQARAWTDRIIATSSGTANSAAIAFTATSAIGNLVNPADANGFRPYGNTTDVINWLRGDRTQEGDTLRERTSLMGAIINSEPVVDRANEVVYVQSGEGMLHAFDIKKDGNPGKEMWAFVPRSVLGSIGQTSLPGYGFKTQLDGAPMLGKFSDTGKLLVAGSGVAGRSFHALDVTSPRDLASAQALTVKWEFPSSALKSQVGLAVGKPLIIKSKNHGYVVLVTSGYNNEDNGIGRMWMLDAGTGAVLKTYTLPTAVDTVGKDAGLAQLAAFGETTGSVRYVYGGDLNGDLWRFDLEAQGDSPQPFMLATLKDASGNRQPITAAPDVTTKYGKRILVVGTGRLLDSSDFGSSRVQSLYVIADGTTSVANVRTGLVRQIYNRGTNTLTTAAVNMQTDRGWYVDLSAGEQINTRPTVVNGAVAFVGNIAAGSDCSASSYLYVLNVLTGGAYEHAGFISRLLSASANFSGLTAIATLDNQTVVTGQSYDGEQRSENISGPPPIPARKNSWVEIRR